MSTSSRLVRNAAMQTSLRGGSRIVSRTLGPSSAYTSYLRRNTRQFPSQMPALALLVPARGISTETRGPQGAPNAPPPGYDPERAKKPIKQEAEEAAAASKSTSGITASPEATREMKPTAVPKTAATDSTSLTEAAAEKTMEKPEAKKEEKKLTLGQKIKKEVMHYWDGTKLLATEIRISSKLALKMAAGYELSRREHRQLQRTVQDLGRLVPFSVFVIVPFAELLLPVALKIFPNMLPSTYEGQKSKEAKAGLLRATRKDVSRFLRDTLKETGLPLSAQTTQKEEFTTFFRKLRATGETPTESDVIKVCQTFKDDLTLDNLSRPQLVAMCRYMSLNTFGTDMMLRYQIRHRMRQIKRDDRAISFEGVDSLSVPELQMACASRGIRSHGVSPARLREDLQSWLDLRLKDKVPSTLLVLSNAFLYNQGKDTHTSQIDALTQVLSSIPEELFHEIELEVHNAEGAATNKQRLEVLKEQQELIEEENEQDEENKESGQATPRDVDNIDEKEERRADSEEHVLVKAQVDEAVDAEKDAAEIKKMEEQAKETSKK